MGYLLTGEKSGWPMRTPRYDGAFMAGLYASESSVAEGHEVAAALPAWSTLLVGVGNETYSPTTPAGEVTNFHQTEYLRCGLVHTALTWTTQDGRVTDLTYGVLTDRTDQHAAAVHLTAVPHWSGQLTVTGLIDFAGARRVDQLGTKTPNATTHSRRTDAARTLPRTNPTPAPNPPAPCAARFPGSTATTTATTNRTASSTPTPISSRERLPTAQRTVVTTGLGCHTRAHNYASARSALGHRPNRPKCWICVLEDSELALRPHKLLFHPEVLEKPGLPTNLKTCQYNWSPLASVADSTRSRLMQVS